MKTQPSWVDKNLFPFESKWIELDGNAMHYIDEGAGPTLLFAHGTPEWSFGYREVIKELRKDFRCVAIDMLGFGLSDKPKYADYSCKAHSARLEQCIRKLDLQNLTIIANDFGGGISLGYAITNPENVQRIVLFNTWMWSLRKDPHYSTPAKVMHTALGRFMYLALNFPVNIVMPAAYGDKTKLTKEIHAHYKKALPRGNRNAAYAFSAELMNASEWWQQLWDNLRVLETKPFLFFWGLKDKFVPPKELEKWTTRLPQAKVITFPDAGHFVQEEKAGEMVIAIRQFFQHPVTA
jgi:pimeloyl-ACP methyl ester carboxylesterase